MPTEKRARQRAGRQARLAALAQQQKRRSNRNRAIALVVAAAVIALIVFAVESGGSPPRKSTTNKSTTTTHTTTTPTTAATTTTTWPVAATTPVTAPKATVDLAKYTTSKDCPGNFKGKLTKPSWPKTFQPPETINKSRTYKATIVTDVGTIVVELDPQLAPANVNNFVFLAENHFYDCVIFHRVIQTFMDQTGDPTGTGTGCTTTGSSQCYPGYSIAADEYPLPATDASKQYPIGSVAMANSGPGTNASQFFIVTGPEGEGLQPDYTLFGHVVSGLSVADKINQGGAPSTSSQGTPVTLHRIISVTISES